MSQRSLGAYVDGVQTFTTTTAQADLSPVQGIQMSHDSLKVNQKNAFTLGGTVPLGAGNLIFTATTGSAANFIATSGTQTLPITSLTSTFTALATGIISGASNARPAGSAH